jgi:alpha-1,3-fucosyltransferase
MYLNRFKLFALFFLGCCFGLLLQSWYLVLLADLDLARFKHCHPVNSWRREYRVTLDGFTYPSQVPLHMNQSLNFECLNNSTKGEIKRILLWNKFFSAKDYLYGLGARTPFKKNLCPVSNCEVTLDKSKLNTSHLVVVHPFGKFEKLPVHRDSRQQWVFYFYESPINSRDMTYLNGFFNLTSTYRIDSDIFSGYHNGLSFHWQYNDSFDEKHDYAQGKKKLAFTVISKCNVHSNRMAYIDSLQEFINIDIFGKCGQPCPVSGAGKRCQESLAKDYKFYFAFENSFCIDYITEKFFTMINMEIIVVVMGAGNYTHYVCIN